MRDISKRRYLIAGIITTLIFVLGLMLGLVIEGKRLEVSQAGSEKQRLELGSLQLQYAYIDQLAQERNCNALAVNFEKNVNTLESARARLEDYYNGASVNKGDFEFIRRDYLIAQFNYWLFARKYQDLCRASIVTVLFFYDDDSRCSTCSDEGFILSYLKSVFGDKLLNFAVYGRYDSEPMVGIIKGAYNVTSYPALVIQDEKHEGFVGRDELKGYICASLNNSHSACST